MTGPRTWLVGMNNPYGLAEKYALYPLPKGAAGDRLCRVILGMDVDNYLTSFNRRNTMVGEWNMRDARLGATKLLEEIPQGHIVVLLGKQVWDAWKKLLGVIYPWESFKILGCKGRTFVLYPHPSGLCRVWNDQTQVIKARETLVAVVPELAPVIPLHRLPTEL